MSRLSHPNDELNHENYNHLGKKKKGTFYPIDKSKDFYDPFSELSLFLSKKIKKEMDEIGCLAEWSGKIEADLLVKILPEFRRRFPRYWIGTSALKKAWERVGYYYKKIQGQKEAFKANGTLNLKYMIRENLKKPITLDSFPPYKIAKQIARKLSECVATLEGTSLELDRLTKLIWAAQKHLIKDFSSLQAKSPYDKYDKIDKLIVKTQLEAAARDKNIDPHILKQKIYKTLDIYSKVKSLIKKSQLTSILSMILAERLYHNSMASCYFPTSKRRAIEIFIRHQIEMGKYNSLLSSDENRLELIQRILAIYTIAEELPKNIEEIELRKSIQQIKESSGKDINPNINQNLYIFINAEMHLMNNHKHLKDSLADAIVKAYKHATSLPSLSSKQVEPFELLIWKIIKEEGLFLSYICPKLRLILKKELGNTLIDNPSQSFKVIVNNTLQFFKKVIPISYERGKISEKIDTWVTQNDMLIRMIHFNPNTPLLFLIEKKWHTLHLDNQPIDHCRFIQNVLCDALSSYPLLSSFKEELQERLWILYKYHWYNTLSDGCASTYERFLLWHKSTLMHQNPQWTQEKLTVALNKLSNQLVPFVPFEIKEQTQK